MVIEIKQRPNKASKLYALMEFCVAVPKDRFYELMISDRDSYRYLNRYCSLDWSGIELAILLRKRLEELGQVSSDRAKSPEERLSEVLKERFGYIPANVNFDYNGRSYSIPLFLYVLRHTFWRPRDVLLYYARILAVAEGLRRKRGKTTSEIIIWAINKVTYEVIDKEFISDLSAVLLNISDILRSFIGCSQFLRYEEVGEILSAVDFRFASEKTQVKEIDEKIDFLYQIGFLGIEATPDLRNRLNLQHDNAFYFNEGLSLLRALGAKKLRPLTFIVHPIFTEYLQIDTSGHSLVLEFTWDYLHRMEVLLDVSGS